VNRLSLKARGIICGVGVSGLEREKTEGVKVDVQVDDALFGRPRMRYCLGVCWGEPIL